MSPNPIRCMLFGGIGALAALASPVVAAPSHEATPDAAPVVVAQVPARLAAAPPGRVEALDAFPSYQWGVRRAAAEGPEALRRYIWRTRMIYNFYYYDFVPKE